MNCSQAATQPFRIAIRELQASGFKVAPTSLAVIQAKTYVTYTNAVFDHRQGKAIVYLPTYGVANLDEAGAKAYRSLGYEVRPIPVRGVFRLYGTTGCLVNVLERG